MPKLSKALERAKEKIKHLKGELTARTAAQNTLSECMEKRANSSRIVLMEEEIEKLADNIEKMKDHVDRSSRQQRAHPYPGAAKISSHPDLKETGCPDKKERGLWRDTHNPEKVEKEDFTETPNGFTSSIFPFCRCEEETLQTRLVVDELDTGDINPPTRKWRIVLPEQNTPYQFKYPFQISENGIGLYIPIGIFYVDVYRLLGDLKWMATNHPSQDGKTEAKKSLCILDRAINTMLLRDGLNHNCVDENVVIPRPRFSRIVKMSDAQNARSPSRRK